MKMNIFGEISCSLESVFHVWMGVWEGLVTSNSYCPSFKLGNVIDASVVDFISMTSLGSHF